MIIDAFTFFNEKELVELRIKYLSDIVDFFLIVEADVTHTGKKKEWNFPKLLNSSLKGFSKINEGDYVAITDVGAYGMSLTSNYNTRPRIAEIMVSGSKYKLIKKRQNLLSLINN